MMSSTSRTRRVSDPLTYALQPPPDETPAQRQKRLEEERAAKKVSDTIDEQIRLEREDRKQKLRKRKEVKVLLLGQSESGKSTTLKQFQLAYTPNAFREERLAWRSVIYLNLVRSVRRVIDALSANDAISAADSRAPDIEDPASGPPRQRRDSSESVAPRPTSPQPSVLLSPLPPLLASARFSGLKERLAPLLAIEDQLIQQLAGSEDDEATQLGHPTSSASRPLDAPSQIRAKNGEVSVNQRKNWKKALTKFTNSGGRPSISDPEGWQPDASDPAHVLNRCMKDIESLWADSEVQDELKKSRIRLEESSGFYLDSLARITALNYIPSDDDVLKARLKTVGIVEHTFSLETGDERGVDWKIYDVGGSRSQRQAWAPYFEDMNAIIFLAPISAFDQVLTEDPRVNRLADTLLLWRSIVSNKLLAKVNIVLFLNKCDLLKRKLDAGVHLNQYMTSYGERPNDHDTVTKYFRNKFLAIYQSYTPNHEREVYLHLTSVTDTRRTSSIISNVRDIILREDLKGIKLL